MPEAKRSSRVATVLLLVALAGGVVFGFWMTVKAHEYYYPGRLHLVIREPDSTFKVEQTGRHELSYRDDLGDLKFDVVSVEKGTPKQHRTSDHQGHPDNSTHGDLK